MSEDRPAELSRQQRLRGLLLGGAVGDALGAPVEFLTRREILARFGPRGITEFTSAYGRLGAVTDDTQMTLFTLEGLIRADIRWSEKGICNPVSVLDHAYRRWLATQDGVDGREPEGKLDGWLVTVPELWSRRAPGTTCLAALRAKGPGFGEQAVNASKGSGAIMRIGPIGLVEAHRPYQLACDAAALTHGHVTAIVAAGWFALWIDGIAQGEPVMRAARRAWGSCRGKAPDLDVALTRAFELAEAGSAELPPAALGEGWTAEEAAAIALWCVAVAATPIEALRFAVNIDGDSDTTGSLVGQVLGAQLGSGWIPRSMLDQLELRGTIETLAADAELIFSGRVNVHAPEGEKYWNKYPGW